MSGDTPFTRVPLVDQIGKDGECAAVEEMLKGNFTLDTSGMDEVHASKAMKSFLAALKILVTERGNKSTPIMDDNMTLKNYTEESNKPRSLQSPPPMHTLWPLQGSL